MAKNCKTRTDYVYTSFRYKSSQYVRISLFLNIMQTLDFVLILHNGLEFSQPLSSLYQAVQTGKTFFIP